MYTVIGSAGIVSQVPFLDVRVEQVMGLMGQGRAQVFLIQPLDAGVLMGEADGHISVKVIKVRAAFSAQLFAVFDGLTAAAAASGGAGHDLHKVIVDLAALDCVDELCGIAQTVGHSGPYRHVAVR